MTGHPPRVFSIPFGTPFLPCIADGLLSGDLVPAFRATGDPLSLADVTIYVPTRRAARELRSVFVDRSTAASAILPDIRPLGDIDDDAALFDGDGGDLDLMPPMDPMERVLQLAPLVQAWKSRLPAHVAAMYDEPLVVPVTAADAIWLARDVAALMDEVELEGADWAAMAELVDRDLAGWWQITLDFLRIVTEHWPAYLAERQRSNPAEHRNRRIDAEAARLALRGSAGPVIAAGSTGSIPATARLLSVIARLPQGAVVLPGLDRDLDDAAWEMLAAATGNPALYGHPQFGLHKLIRQIGIRRQDIPDLPSRPAQPAAKQVARGRIISEALRPAETTDRWTANAELTRTALAAGALDDVTIIQAASERDEALAITIAIRRALHNGDKTTALVTGDRSLARRVSAELERYGIAADDSAGTPLSGTLPGTLLLLIAQCVARPGDPVELLSLVKHPLVRLGMTRQDCQIAAATVELVAFRTGPGRPEIALFDRYLKQRFADIAEARHKPVWMGRVDERRSALAQDFSRRLSQAVEPLNKLRAATGVTVSVLADATVAAFEAIGADEQGGFAELYDGEAGEAAVSFLRNLVAAEGGPDIAVSEWPEVLSALMAGHVVKPPAGADSRVFIWGALEARLQFADTIVLGGLNEGSWPAKTDADRFMSRFMKTGLGLEPPERRTGLAAHDFLMAFGMPKVVLSRSVRAGEEPAVASRWLQRLLTLVAEDAAKTMVGRGDELLRLKALLDQSADVDFARRPCPAPPAGSRPKRFSVTEIETLRRDPYAVFARRILRLEPLEDLGTEPGPRERGTIFHDVLDAAIREGLDPASADAPARLEDIAGRILAAAGLPDDIGALWWPRLLASVPHIVEYERESRESSSELFSEISASATPVGATGVVLSGRADRIAKLPGGDAVIVDFKTGSTPSRGQARTLFSPQLALEGALLTRGAFADVGPVTPADLAYVRLKPDGSVVTESILEEKGKRVIGADELSQRAWQLLTMFLDGFNMPSTGYLSRALPFRESDMDGDYDHLARVLEWSAGGDNGGDGQ